METWQFVVTGRVQGVSFRAGTVAFVAENVPELGGFVRNLRDGRVEVWAQGEASQLEELHQYLKKGPPGARVDEVERYTHAGMHSFKTFKIADTL